MCRGPRVRGLLLGGICFICVCSRTNISCSSYITSDHLTPRAPAADWMTSSAVNPPRFNEFTAESMTTMRQLEKPDDTKLTKDPEV